MESFWEIINKILKGIQGRDVSNMMEFEFDMEEEEVTICFHTVDNGNIVISIFDPEQWSLIEDMSKFLGKEPQDIIKDLDPSGNNIFVVDPKEL